MAVLRNGSKCSHTTCMLRFFTVSCLALNTNLIFEIGSNKWRKAMMQLEDIRDNEDLLNAIDWDMTPEEAVRLYLEWGNNWAGGNYVIRSKDDITHYFVVNTWDENPVIFLIRRNSEEAVELGKIDMPDDIKDRFLEENGNLKGVFAIEGNVKDWLYQQLNNM